MGNLADIERTLARVFPALALILMIGFAPVACAAMVSQLSTDAHPCCPNHGNAGSNPCAKTGCIANVPVLPEASTGFAIALPVLAQVLSNPAARSSAGHRLSDVDLHFFHPDVFLKNHALLI